MYGLGAVVETISGVVGAYIGAPEPLEQTLRKDVSVSDITKQSLEALTANRAGAESAASATNLFNYDQLKKIVEMASPDIFKTIGKAGAAIGDMVSGKLPDDVLSYIMDSGAARALSGGYGPNGGGGSFSNYKSLRDLGRTSADQSMRGITALGSYLTGLKNFLPQQQSPTDLLPSLNQTLQYSMWNQDRQYEADVYNAQVRALPDPFLAAVGAAITSSGQGFSFSGMGMGGGSGSTPKAPKAPKAASTGNWWEQG